MPYVTLLQGLPVQRKDIAEAPGMTPVHHIAQGGFLELAVLAEAPVVGDDGEVADALRWLLFLDDQQAVEPARHLFPGASVRVVPEGAGVGYREAVVEGP